MLARPELQQQWRSKLWFRKWRRLRENESELPPGLYVGRRRRKLLPSPANRAQSSGEFGQSESGGECTSATGEQQPPPHHAAGKLGQALRSGARGLRQPQILFGDAQHAEPELRRWQLGYPLRGTNHDSSNHDRARQPDLSQPMATRKVDPAYPIQLMRENVAGTVILYAVIHADGSVGNVRVCAAWTIASTVTPARRSRSGSSIPRPRMARQSTSKRRSRFPSNRARRKQLLVRSGCGDEACYAMGSWGPHFSRCLREVGLFLGGRSKFRRLAENARHAAPRLVDVASNVVY